MSIIFTERSIFCHFLCPHGEFEDLEGLRIVKRDIAVRSLYVFCAIRGLFAAKKCEV